MLDLAIIDALDKIKSPPAIVRSLEEIVLNEAPASMAKRFDSNLSLAEAQIESWVRDGLAARESLSSAFQKALDEALDPALFMPNLNERIRQVEAASIRSAKESDELASRIKRQRKQAAQISPEFDRMYASVYDRMLALMEREHEERGDFVLFMKAWRARFDPPEDSIPSFDDPKALDRYLRSVLAA
jgi:hypothetical protein